MERKFSKGLVLMLNLLKQPETVISATYILEAVFEVFERLEQISIRDDYKLVVGKLLITQI